MKIDVTDIEKKDGEIQLPEGFPEVEKKPEVSEEPVVERPEAEVQEAGTLQPVITYVKENAVLVGALGVVIILLVILLISTLCGKKKGKAAKSKIEELPEEKETAVTQPEEENQDQSNIPVSAASVHEIGAREDQQDSFGISDYAAQGKGLLAVVADGMGGLTNGKAVSSLLVNTCFDVFHSLPAYVAKEDMLLQMAVQSNAAVNQMLGVSGRSGSTLVAASVANGQLYFLTVGDSRIYLYRSGALLQLNREHIYKEELSLDAVNGRMSIYEVNNDPQAKSLTSYFGIGRIPHLDRNYEGIRLIKGDKMILASDGVFGTLSLEQMEMALQLPAKEAAEKLREQVAAANRPYQDNYTAVVLEYRG